MGTSKGATITVQLKQVYVLEQMTNPHAPIHSRAFFNNRLFKLLLIQQAFQAFQLFLNFFLHLLFGLFFYFITNIF